MKIFVTGGAGYIGSICAEEMLNRGHEVAVLDNLTEGHRAAVDPRAVFFEADLSDREAVTRAASVGFDQVVIRPALPVDLRGTAAARAAVKFLTDGGASATWQQYVAADPDGRQLVGHELRIEWGGARL